MEVPDTNPDATMLAIDRFFDLVDKGVDRVDNVLNLGKKPAEKTRSRRARGSEVVSKSPSAESRDAAQTLGAGNALTRRPRFYIVESIVGCSTQFVVTDGGKARTVCATRQFAEQVLQALEKAP